MKKLKITLCLFMIIAGSLQAQTIPNYVPSNGLVGWWPFNGNANDESGNGHDGIVNGPVLTTDRNGLPNGAYLFNGNQQFIDCGQISSLNNSSYLTISAWFEYNSIPNNSRIIGAEYSGNAQKGWGFCLDTYFTSGNAIKGCMRNNNFPTGSNELGYGPQNLTPGVFYHGVMVFDGTKSTSAEKLKIYINGVQQILTFVDPIPNTLPTSNFKTTIGNEDGTHDTPWDGILDDIGIWNRALSQQEITALYQSNTCSVPAYVPTNGLVGYWPFCGNANDVSGNNNNGAVNGATLSTDRFGDSNSAYLFDGIDDIINSGGITFFNLNNLSISIWYKELSLPNGSSDEHTLLSKSTSLSGEIGYRICTDVDNIDRFIVSRLAIPQAGTGFVEGGIASTGVWTNIIAVKDGSNLIIYKNGVSVGTNASISAIISNNEPLYFGGRINSSETRYFHGYLDDIGIWNRALTQQEITTLYTSQVPCTKPEPVSLGTSASTKLCPSESVTIEIVAPADSSNYTYQWTRNGTNMVGATTRSITVNDAAKYKVFVSSGPGVDCRRVSGLVETTPSIPPTIVATAPNGTSYCPGDSVLMTATGATAGYSYRWKRFGVVIPGANSNTFYATQTGNYRCETYNAGGCITQSNLISITNGTSCRIMGENNSDVSVYPNPAQNAFTVSFIDIGNEKPVSVELINGSGQIVLSQKLIDKSDVLLNASKVVSGNYRLKIHLESGDIISRQISITH
ncbi:MAG: LamG-like jellyroll fold domain-containing protein [Arcticibacter sp.]